ncbi:MAG: ABC transporter ATP-binding protein [Spirochaetales bacterium]|nr:ABC transporter ATP-binding protein [Spirochaetales bacterium]
MNILTVEHLRKSYVRCQAVKGVSFAVPQGSIFGILGPNGSGKTTTLECILGTKEMDEGTVRLLDRDPRRDRKMLFERVGVQFQDSSWQNSIRIGELCESTVVLYTPEPEWRGRLKALGFDPKQMADTLSGGEKQKLSILLASLHNPEVLFLDELTTGLDPLSRRLVWDKIRELRDRGTTVILTSHFMDEVEALCDSCLLLYKGKVLTRGTPEELKKEGGSASLEDAYINLIGGAA